MRKLTKLLALLLTLSLVLAIPTVALASRPEAEAWQEGNAVARVDEIEIEGRICYMYVPSSPRVGNLLQNTNVFFVFGDGAFADAKAVKDFAVSTGLAAICDREGVCALFFNPKTTWAEEADPNALIVGGYNMFSTWPDLKFENGVATSTWHDYGPSNSGFSARQYPLDLPKYPGSFQHVMFFGFGTGADFVNNKGMEPQVFQSTYGYQNWSSDAFGSGQTPAAVYLYNPTTLVEGDGSLTIPTVIVNGPANAAAVAASYSINAGGSVNTSIFNAKSVSPEKLMELYDDVLNSGSVRYWYNGLTECGIRYPFTNPTTGKDDWLKYYAYIPDCVDLAATGTVPMLIWCHGAGGEGESQCDWSGWITKAGKEGFIILSLDQHSSVANDAIFGMIDQFIADHPCVDTTRLYFGGFSMGSMKTWSTTLPNWYRFAAIIPNAGGNRGILPDAVPADCMLPVFYIAGGLSASEFGAGLTNTLKVLWKMNGIGEYAYDAEKGYFGTDSDTFEIYGHSGSGAADNKQLYVYGFESANGETITWLSICPNRAHTVVATDPDIVWEYIKGFARNADGTLSKDGKVISSVLKPAPVAPEEPAPDYAPNGRIASFAR